MKIKELKTTGRVKAIYEDSTGVQFYVRYFWNGEAKTVYFYADELEATEAAGRLAGVVVGRGHVQAALRI